MNAFDRERKMKKCFRGVSRDKAIATLLSCTVGEAI